MFSEGGVGWVPALLERVDRPLVSLMDAMSEWYLATRGEFAVRAEGERVKGRGEAMKYYALEVEILTMIVCLLSFFLCVF